MRSGCAPPPFVAAQASAPARLPLTPASRPPFHFVLVPPLLLSGFSVCVSPIRFVLHRLGKHCTLPITFPSTSRVT